MNADNWRNRPLYNSRIINTYVKFVKTKYPEIDIVDLLHSAGIEPYEVADQSHWFSQNQVNSFQKRLFELTGNANIAREAGRYAASPESIGVMRQYALGLLSPATVYDKIGSATANFSKSSISQSEKLSSNKYKITVSPVPPAVEEPFQCENRKGFFEAIAMVFTSKLPSLSHPECIFKGGKKCVYIISWDNPSYKTLKRLRNIFTIIFLLPIFILYLITNEPYIAITISSSLLLVICVNLIISYLEKKDLKSGANTLFDATDKLINQMDLNYNNALLTNEMGQILSRYNNQNDVLSNFIRVCKKRLDYDRGMIFLSDDSEKKLAFCMGYGHTPEQYSLLEKTYFHLDKPKSKGAFVVSFRKQKPMLINDIQDIEKELSLKSRLYAKRMGSNSFICCPIISLDKSVGLFVVDNVHTKRPLVQSDINLLIDISSVLGISLRNLKLFEQRERQFRSILQVLAASIDARDPLTAGHSEKVTQYSIAICNELTIEREFIEVIRVAALLHDYGKIGVPDSLLMKNGRLSFEEFEVIKTHANKTKKILEQINFEGVFNPGSTVIG